MLFRVKTFSILPPTLPPPPPAEAPTDTLPPFEAASAVLLLLLPLLLPLLLLLLLPAFLCELAIRRRRSKGCTTGKRQAKASKARRRVIYN